MKIKDNVDLKLLEKYGFHRVFSNICSYYHYYPFDGVSLYVREDDFINSNGILLEEKRVLIADNSFNWNKNKRKFIYNSVVKKLINAGLVEFDSNMKSHQLSLF